HNNQYEYACEKPCLNGKCVGVNECACLPGYKKTDSEFECLPHCDYSCGAGFCSAPNWCTCTGGSFQIEHFCTQFCIELSIFRHRIWIDTASCAAIFGWDYKLSQSLCDKPCMNGDCVGVNECQCTPGYKKGYNKWVCLPHCDFDCGYGYCSAPNKCTCTGGHMWMPKRNICD
ncbi:hypothetical protein L9F63_010926, partial [Diploptera punctata]